MAICHPVEQMHKISKKELWVSVVKTIRSLQRLIAMSDETDRFADESKAKLICFFILLLIYIKKDMSSMEYE